MFYCPCCEQYSESFLTFGNVPRPNAQCPNCLSLERHRQLLLYLKQETPLFKKRFGFLKKKFRLLHIAPEKPLFRIFYKLDIDYVTADLNSLLSSPQQDLRNLSFKNHSFDMIICYHVLEHIQNDLKAIRELHRVLKNNGMALIHSPIYVKLAKTFENPKITSEKDREKYFGYKDHVRKYGIDFQDRLNRGGFRVIVEDFASTLPPEKVKEYALNPKEKIYLCFK